MVDDKKRVSVQNKLSCLAPSAGKTSWLKIFFKGLKIFVKTGNKEYSNIISYFITKMFHNSLTCKIVIISLAIGYFIDI